MEKPVVIKEFIFLCLDIQRTEFHRRTGAAAHRSSTFQELQPLFLIGRPRHIVLYHILQDDALLPKSTKVEKYVLENIQLVAVNTCTAIIQPILQRLIISSRITATLWPASVAIPKTAPAFSHISKMTPSDILKYCRRRIRR